MRPSLAPLAALTDPACQKLAQMKITERGVAYRHNIFGLFLFLSQSIYQLVPLLP